MTRLYISIEIPEIIYRCHEHLSIAVMQQQQQQHQQKQVAND